MIYRIKKKRIYNVVLIKSYFYLYLVLQNDEINARDNQHYSTIPNLTKPMKISIQRKDKNQLSHHYY